MRQYNTILEQEEIFWKQKSRMSWLQFGDCNTRFFHMSTIVRRGRNRIRGLYDLHGKWCDSKAEIKQAMVHYFIDLYAQSTHQTCSMHTKSISSQASVGEKLTALLDLESLSVKKRLQCCSQLSVLV